MFSFDVDDARQFVKKFTRLITRENFPQDGLILDVRGNPGGNIRAAESLLQLFTPNTIEPELFEFINTPDVLHLMTKRDILNDNVDLLARAARIIQQRPSYQLSVKPVSVDGASGIVVSAASKVPWSRPGLVAGVRRPEDARYAATPPVPTVGSAGALRRTRPHEGFGRRHRADA